MQAWADYLDRLRSGNSQSILMDMPASSDHSWGRLRQEAKGREDSRKSEQKPDGTAPQLELFLVE